eukprot:gene12580-3280_t
MDKQKVTILILLDLSAAFDTVDLQILSEIFQQRFNISGAVFNWFISFLKNREQRIMIGDTLSEIYTLKYGVPQGSCAGPVVFLGYLSSLYDIIELHSPNVAAYADDTQLYLGFNPSCAEERIQAKRKTKHSEANVWATKRLQSDICHIVPAISEVLLDIVDILEDACDQYIESINEELQNLETSLQRYSSTMSLNVNEEELQSLDKINNFTKEIELQRTNFQNTYRNCHEMLTSLDRFGTSTRNIFTGGSSCLGTLQTEIKEVIQMLQSMELKVRQTEGRLAMAQKHFDARRRRAGDGKRKLL